MKKILLLTGVLCLASVGGVSAYLTDYDKVSNQFTVGKVDVELTEAVSYTHLTLPTT